MGVGDRWSPRRGARRRSEGLRRPRGLANELLVIARAELGERIPTHQEAGETALAVGKAPGVPTVDDHPVVRRPHDVVEQVLEHRIRVPQQDVLAGIQSSTGRSSVNSSSECLTLMRPSTYSVSPR